MNLQQWRSGKTTETTLPSGLEVVLKRASLVDMAVNGEIPNTLLGLVDQVSSQGKDVQISASNFGEFGQLINVVVKACVVQPPIADEADETHLGIKELSMPDRLFIFNWANEDTQKMASFREEEKKPVAAVLDESGVRAETISDLTN